MDARTLSGEEVSALVSELGDHDAGASDSPRSFSLGNDATRPLASLPALNRMSERMARDLREALEPFSRRQPRITAEPVTLSRYATWRAEQAEFTSFSLYRLRPLKGGMLVTVEPDMISALVDACYGGTGTPIARKSKEFTGVEEQMLARVTEATTRTLATVWADIMAVDFQLMNRETNPAFVALVEAEESVAVARFRIELATGQKNVIDIVYPVAALRPIESELSSKAFEESGLGDGEWRNRMIAALREVHLDARSVLARPELTWADLLSLKEGDVIPISFPNSVPLLVAGREFALGRIGDQDGRAALKIETMSHGGE